MDIYTQRNLDTRYHVYVVFQWLYFEYCQIKLTLKKVLSVAFDVRSALRYKIRINQSPFQPASSSLTCWCKSVFVVFRTVCQVSRRPQNYLFYFLYCTCSR